MATENEIKSRVENIEEAVTLLTRSYSTLTNIMVNQELQIAELKEQSTYQQAQLDELRRQTAEIKRDSQKTRRLWIAIAKQLDWLDLPSATSLFEEPA